MAAMVGARRHLAAAASASAVLAVLTAACVGATRAADPPELLRLAAAEVDAASIRRHVRVLGSDAFEGRGPGAPGGDRAASYLAATLREAGVAPFGEDGGFLQPMAMVGSTPLPASRLRVVDRGDVVEASLGEDYVLYSTGSQTWLPRPTPMVFIGYGIVAPEFDYDDYADVEVEGRVVVFLEGEPRSRDPAHFDGERLTIHAALESKVRTAVARGAAASVMVPTGSSWFGPAWAAQQREFGHEDMALALGLARHLAVVAHPERLAPALFEKALFDLEQVLQMDRASAVRSFHLTAALSFEGAFRDRTFLSSNVVGLVEGVDYRLKDSFVVLSAHYDHLGIGPGVDGDSIYNGVVDNATGVAGVLEMARVLSLARFRPQRSVVVLLSTGEERGNLGSRYFLEHPPAPLARMVANVNVDGLAFRAPPQDLIGIGGELSTLGESLRRAARAVGLRVTEPPEGGWTREAFVRSDQVAFAEKGIPAMLVTEGFRWHGWSPAAAFEATAEWMGRVYHTPADDLSQPLDFEAMARHAGVVLAVVLDVGMRPSEPEWRAGAPAAYARALHRAQESRGGRP